MEYDEEPILNTKKKKTGLSSDQKKIIVSSALGLGTGGLAYGISFAALNANSEDSPLEELHLQDLETTIPDNLDSNIELIPARVSEANYDDLPFGEAFANARAELGAGGVFVYKGEQYGTYYKEEWDELSEDQKDSYWESVEAADIDTSSYTIEETPVQAGTTEYDSVSLDLDEDGIDESTGYDTNFDETVDLLTSDTNLDGETDMAVFDTDLDGNFDSAIIDTNFDRKYDVAAGDTDGDGEMDSFEEISGITTDDLAFESNTQNAWDSGGDGLDLNIDISDSAESSASTYDDADYKESFDDDEDLTSDLDNDFDVSEWA